ncbi:MAG: hypothetical protein IJC48_00520 [Clostridia bacterium]|nr:hypothetical protein [Clostridia bacterium]
MSPAYAIRRTLLISLFILISLTFCISFAVGGSCAHQWTYSSVGSGGHNKFCANCTAAYSEAHVITISTKPATCSTPKLVTFSCSLCGYSNTKAEGTGTAEHTWGPYSTTRSPTCTTEGVSTRQCLVCGAKDEQAILTAEHDYGAWGQFDETWHIKYCKDCGKYYKGSHRINDGEITTAPTESSLGEIVYECRVCGETFERFISLSGTVYSKDTEEIMKDGIGYLLVEEEAKDTAKSREIVQASGALMDVIIDDDIEFSIYANAESGESAGLFVKKGTAEADIVPETGSETMNLEFLKLEKGAKLKMRIWNSNGDIAVQNAGGFSFIVSQRKTQSGEIITALTKITRDKTYVDGTISLYSSKKGELLFTNPKGTLTCGLSDDNKLIGSATWKYTIKSSKISASAKDENGSFKEIAYTLYADGKALMTAQGIKTASDAIKAQSADSLWRLRIAFASGHVLQTPFTGMDGSIPLLADGELSLTSEKAAELDLKYLATPEPTPTPTPTAEPTAEPTPKAAAEIEIEMTFEPVFSEEPVLTPEPTLIVFAPAPTEESAESDAEKETPESAYETVQLGAVLTPDSRAEYISADLNGLSARFEDMTYTVTLSGDVKGMKIDKITLIQRNSASSFDVCIQNAFSSPAVFTLERANGAFSAEATLKDEKGREVKAEIGRFTLSME